MDALDRKIINTMQKGFPLSQEPYAEIAAQLEISEKKLIDRLACLLKNNTLSRFGPLYDVQKIGGAFSLVAMKVPEIKFEETIKIVNSYTEVAHNYHRDHIFNMWYVLATEIPQQIEKINHEIEQRTGLKVYNMPKLNEYYIGLQLSV